MIKKVLLSVFIFIFSASLFISPIVISSAENSVKKNFKVVGYCSEVFDDPIESIQFDKLTHIIYAFLIPREDGSLVPLAKPEKLEELVKKSHQNNVEVLIAVGGWSYNNAPLYSTFEKLAASDSARNQFIANISLFLEKYNLDGIELDWEYPDLGTSSQNYEKLVLELKKEMTAKGKHLTAAVAGSWSSSKGSGFTEAITSPCLNAFDWINIMAYDLLIYHSPYWYADKSADYWINRGVPKEKIIIGVPFYAKPSWKQYRTLVSENSENAYKDYAQGSYYNGINTIKEKTRLAYKKASGIMIFDINEDAEGDLSLLKAIDDMKKAMMAMSDDELKNKIYFILNNKEVLFDDNDGMGMPFIGSDNRTMVPARKCLENIGADISFDLQANTVIARKNNITVEIPIGKNYIEVNGNIVDIDSKPIIKNNRTYVPFRAVFEAFNYRVEWHSGSNTIVVSNTE